jgi:hypothetical protein
MVLETATPFVHNFLRRWQKKHFNFITLQIFFSGLNTHHVIDLSLASFHLQLSIVPNEKRYILKNCIDLPYFPIYNSSLGPMFTQINHISVKTAFFSRYQTNIEEKKKYFLSANNKPAT